MEKETIEANDEKFREKLQDLRSKLSSRRFFHQNKNRSFLFSRRTILFLAILAIASYFTAHNTIMRKNFSLTSHQLLKTEKQYPQFSKENSSRQTIPAQSPAKPENHSSSRENIGNKSIAETTEIQFLPGKKSFDSPNEISIEKNPKTEKISEAASFSDKSGGQPLKTGQDSFNPEKGKGGDGHLSHHTRISGLLTCSSIDSRTCAGRRSVFALDEDIKPHVWMEVHSESVPYILKHVYYHEGQKYCEVPLQIKFPRMRTWSNITLGGSRFKGSWRVEIVTEDGSILDQTAFRVVDKKRN